MPEQPDEPVSASEPRTLDAPRDSGRRSREMESERPTIRRVAFWVIVALVLVTGIALYFLYADAVTPVLRTDG